MQNMAERLSEDGHDIWASKKKEEIEACGNCIPMNTLRNQIQSSWCNYFWREVLVFIDLR